METNEKRHGWKEAAALSGGHLCHVCGYQYPNPNPSAKLRRSHRKHCGKALPEAAEEAVVAEVDEAVVGVGVCVGEREDVAGNRNAAGRTVLGTSAALAGDSRLILSVRSLLLMGWPCVFVPLQVRKEDGSERRLARARPMEEARRCADLREKLTVLLRTR
jgi:hypothetical protein